MIRRLAALAAAAILLVTFAAPAAAGISSRVPVHDAAAAAARPVTARQTAIPSGLPASETDETKVPHYFGPYSNWANSPQVLANAIVELGKGTPTPGSYGNPLIGRAYATSDVASAPTPVVAASITPAGAVYSASVGSATGGTFTLTVGGATTAALAYNAAAADVQTALNALAGVTATVTGSAPWVITFAAAPASVSISGAGLTQPLQPVLVVVPAPLPAGQLSDFQTWNQALVGSGTLPSAGQSFHAFVLRPAAAGQYTVVFDSGFLTVPAPAVPGTGEVATFTLAAPVAVNAGDVIAFYGTGVPVDTTAGSDLTYNPAPTPPALSATITLPGADFPLAAGTREYSFAATVTPTAVDPATIAQATANVDPKTGGISSITVTNPGDGYVVAPKVTITSPGVSPTTLASATSVISTGVVNGVAVNEWGFGFTKPSVSFSGGSPSKPATAVASGGVDNVTIVDGGGVYTTHADVTFGLPDQPGGVQATGTATFDANGAINAVTVVNPGSGYSQAPTVTITDSGTNPPAVPAKVTATINIGQIDIISGGKGYTSAPAVTISDTVGTADKGASATASVSAKGAVTAINVTVAGAGYLTPGIKKFVDTLAGLTPAGANNLGNYIPIAVPDTTTYPGADYYEIGVVQYRHQFSSMLPPTLERGYVQLSTAVIPGNRVLLTNANLDPLVAAAPAMMPDGVTQALGVDNPNYLGPTIIASKDRPVRILFRDLLPTGVDGNLFLPVDTSLMGSGMGPNAVKLDANGVPIDTVIDQGKVTDEVRNPMCGLDKMECYSENRATLHLHGGVTPWISDGTPHQWTTPAGETTDYPQGVSVSNVPDMPDPGPGALTFFYTNQQSARLMFYHDHAWGITRLNVYAGEAAGYVLTDATEQALIAPGGALDGLGVGTPLVIQDKTFVPDNVHATDPTWDTSRWGGTGSLWAPHVYMPAQNPGSPTGMSSFGRWMYGPWFWPPAKEAKYPPIANPYYGLDPKGLDGIAGTADDWKTPLAVPCDLADPATWQYQSDPWCEPALIPSTTNVSVGMEAFNDTPIVNGTAYPTTTVDPKAYRFRILSAANDRFWNLQWYVADPTTGTLSEVALNPADLAAAQTNPDIVPQPDLTKSPAGPNWIQIGTEGGFLPTPVVVPNQPITWIVNPTRFDVGNVDKHSLLLAPAERADVIVDFSAYRGKTLILYNDAPAAFPARQANMDYYTGGPDMTGSGGAPTTLPGYGPNTRTIMQVKVSNAVPALAWDRPNTTNDRMGALMAAFAHHLDPVTGKPAGVFESGSDPIIVGQAAYNDAYGTNFAAGAWCSAPKNPAAKCDGYARVQEGSQPTDRFKFDTLSKNQLSLPFQPKGLHDEANSASFDEWGRMTANLGLEAPGATPLAQNIILYPYVNPATELLNSSGMPSALKVTQISTSTDGTQIWKITHNGVDTHPMHWHLYDVQVINRVTWDNIIIPPDPTELGWKDTVRLSPLEDTIVALRPIVPTLPFNVPDSRRPLNPMMPVGATGSVAGGPGGLAGQEVGFNNTDTNGNPIAPIVNTVENFNWEYVYHCHILSHEEMDMMRPVSVYVPSTAPDAVLQLPTTPGSVNLHWIDATPVNYLDPASWDTANVNHQQEIRFDIYRADTGGSPAVWPTDYNKRGSALANATTWHDTNGVGGRLYSYVVLAVNEGGASPESNVQTAVFGLDVTASSHTLVFGDAVPTITATYAPTSPAPATPASCSTTYTKGAGVGTYPTTCSGIGVPDAIYGTSINYIAGTITVGPKPLTVTGRSSTVTYGAPVPNLSPIYGGLVAPATVPATPATCTTPYTVSSLVAGSPYAVTCAGAADPNYTFTYIPGLITVGKATVTVTASSPTVVYGAAAPAITPIYAGFLHGETAPATTAPTCSTTYVAGNPVATYPTSCTGAADPNYTFLYTAGTLLVGPAPLTITASSGTMVYGGTVPAITPGYAGLRAGDLAPATPPTCSTTATSTSPVASYPSTCTGAADSNYTISYVAGSVSVTAAPLTITASSGTMVYGGTV
ncbi:MAG: MBG domain-containing protein, partial [Chloroflexota bacterium]